jgi:hypothetical protein
MDFKHWESVSSDVLWLTGPSELNLRQIASHIVDLAKNDEPQNYILYFFCMSVVGKKSTATSFVGGLLRQLVQRVQLRDKSSVIAEFLGTLLDGVVTKEQGPHENLWRFEESPDEMIRKIVDRSAGSEHLGALKVVLELKQVDIKELSIVVAELDRVTEYHTGDFVTELRSFIAHLQSRLDKVKVLFTSRPQTGLMHLLQGLPSIEHGKEIKGSTIFHSLPVLY